MINQKPQNKLPRSDRIRCEIDGAGTFRFLAYDLDDRSCRRMVEVVWVGRCIWPRYQERRYGVCREGTRQKVGKKETGMRHDVESTRILQYQPRSGHRKHGTEEKRSLEIAAEWKLRYLSIQYSSTLEADLVSSPLFHMVGTPSSSLLPDPDVPNPRSKYCCTLPSIFGALPF